MNLLMILAVLFIALGVIVTLAEKYAKPLDQDQQQKYSKAIGILMGVMVLAMAIAYFIKG